MALAESSNQGSAWIPVIKSRSSWLGSEAGSVNVLTSKKKSLRVNFSILIGLRVNIRTGWTNPTMLRMAQQGLDRRQTRNNLHRLAIHYPALGSFSPRPVLALPRTQTALPDTDSYRCCGHSHFFSLIAQGAVGIWRCLGNLQDGPLNLIDLNPYFSKSPGAQNLNRRTEFP